MKVNGSAQTDEALGGWNGWTLGSHWWTNVVWLISNLSFTHVFLKKNHHFLFINSPFVQFISSLYTYYIYSQYIYTYTYIYIKYLHISTYLCCVTPTFSSGAPSFPSIAPEKYEAGPPCWRSSVQGRGNDLIATETREWWSHKYRYNIFNIHMRYEHYGVSPDSLGWFKSRSTGSSSVEKQNHFPPL